MDKGIAVAGNMIVDVIKLISGFPVRHELVRITGKSYALGGLACNVLGTLARLDPGVPLTALSRIGEDSEGELILKTLSRLPSIDLSLVKRQGVTSFTDVLTEVDSRARTFLFYSGADSAFDMDDVPLDALDCDVFHAGYICLLPALDQPDPQFGTRMARLLAGVRERGIQTSVDVVSEVGDRYPLLVPPALRHADYFIVNELESGKTVGIELRSPDGRLLIDRIPDVLYKLKQMGVHRWAVIHAPEGGFGMDERGRYAALPSLKLPDGFIKGTVGAGDAFCAGCLYAAYRGEPLETGIRYGIAAAALSLSEPGGADGVKPIAEAMALYHALPKQEL